MRAWLDDTPGSGMRTSLLGVRPMVISRLSNDVVVGGWPVFEIVMRSMRRGWMFARPSLDGKSPTRKSRRETSHEPSRFQPGVAGSVVARVGAVWVGVATPAAG